MAGVGFLVVIIARIRSWDALMLKLLIIGSSPLFFCLHANQAFRVGGF